MRFLLALRSIFFLLLLPGSVAGYIPMLILKATGRLHIPGFSLACVAAAALASAGVVVLLKCIWDFFATGKGTLAPIDPPKHLVVSGLYRYTRNPMYNGVLAILIGEAWLFTSIWLIGYALVVLTIFYLFVVFYEEPVLEASFGEAYRVYRRAVPRWGFTIHPFR
jgi:protein-S-isoprenylcysteine O-methyltransferase Ste14